MYNFILMCFNASRSRSQLPKILNAKFYLYSHIKWLSFCSKPCWTICFKTRSLCFSPTFIPQTAYDIAASSVQ